jgi:Uma2 family endonuclease
MTLLTLSTAPRTVDDLLHQLGDVPATRVRIAPPPGQATVQDVIDVRARDRALCELIDGTLVEKPVGYRESIIAVALASLLQAFVRPRKLGVVTGEAGMMQLAAAQVRIPDVAYTSWARLGGSVPSEQVPLVAPDLAVEILSPSNSPREMDRKRLEYFGAGVRLVWVIDIDARSAAVYTDPETFNTVTDAGSLDGGDVLPGFAVPLRDLFAELDAV